MYIYIHVSLDFLRPKFEPSIKENTIYVRWKLDQNLVNYLQKQSLYFTYVVTLK